MSETYASIATRDPGQAEVVGGPYVNEPEPLSAAPTDGAEGTGRGGDGRSPETEGPARRTFTVPEVPYRRLAGLVMSGIGVLIVLFLVYLFAFTPLTASRNQQRLVQSLVGHPLAVYSLVAGNVPAEGSPVAVLDIPALHLHQVVVEGTSAADLMNGPGLMPGSALPGSPGNSVIAARRVTFGGPFGALGQLHAGDTIRTVDGAGRFTYRVTRVLTVTAGEHDVVTPTVADRITLVTSNSSFVTSGRLVVQGKLIGRPVAVPSNIVAVPTYDLGLSGDQVAGGLAVMWSLITLIVLAGAGLAVWRWRRPWLIYLFAAPILMACGLFACESVARALPATF